MTAVQLRPSTPTVVVTTDDGTVLSCTPQQVGGADAGRIRWMIADPEGRERTGPPYLGFSSQTDVHRLICEWWDTRPA